MKMEESVKETPKEIFLKDYKAPHYAFEKVKLDILIFLFRFFAR